MKKFWLFLLLYSSVDLQVENIQDVSQKDLP